MKITIKKVFKKRSKNEKSGLLNVRVTIDRNSKYYPTGIRIKESSWSKSKGIVLSSEPNHESYNKELKALYKKCKKKYKSNKQEEKLESINKSSSIIQLFKNRIDDLNEAGSYGTAKSYKTVYHHLLPFLGKKKEFKFEDIDLKWLKRFDLYLNKSGVNANSRSKYLKIIQALYNLGIRDLDIEDGPNPFRHFTFKYEDVKIERLTTDHINNLTIHNCGEDKELEKIRNHFIFQIYAGGLRLSDLLTIRFNQLNFDDSICFLEFTQYKTRKDAVISVNAELMKYLFAIIDYDHYKKIYKEDKYSFKYGSNTVTASLEQIDSYGSLLIESSESIGVLTKEWEEFEQEYKGLMLRIYTCQLLKLKSITKERMEDFICDILPNNAFTDVTFDANRRLSKRQYSKIESCEVEYNEKLKRLNDLTGSNISITSHQARHSMANAMANEGVDILAIKGILGHQKIQTTTTYMESFNRNITARNSEQLLEKIRFKRIKKTRKPALEDIHSYAFDLRDDLFDRIDPFIGENHR